MTIGERIKQKRLELGLTQDELAKKVGYSSRSSINKIELSRELPLKKIEIMSRALGCSPSYLMGWDDDEPSEVTGDASNPEPDSEGYYLDPESAELAEFAHKNPEYKALFDASRKVKPEDINFVLEMIKRTSNYDD